MADREEAPTCMMSGARLVPCADLAAVTQPFGTRGTRAQGITIIQLVNAQTYRLTREVAVLRSGEHGKTGIRMVFCPFCGEQIFEPRVKEAAHD